jgi:hypothetical protein
MAKKRRKPHSRPRAQTPIRANVGTAERRPQTETDGPNGSPSVRRRPAGPEPGGANPQAGASQRSRTEKKELARRQREEIRRRVQRAQRMRQLAWVVGAGLLVGAAVFWFARPDQPTERPETLPGELTSLAPWDANADLVADRIDAIGLPGHGTNLAMHEHANVQIFVDGAPVPIPVNVGIDEADGDVASLHTHSPDGLVHIESSTEAEFTLGQFFDVWGVRFDDRCLGGYCEQGEGEDQDQVRVFVRGTEATGPVRDVALDDVTTIVVTFGTEDELPDPIPSHFDFSSITP